MSSFKSSENILKKEGGPDRSVPDNRSSSVTLNELAMKARESYCNLKLQQISHTMTDIYSNRVKISTIWTVLRKPVLRLAMSGTCSLCRFRS